MKTLIALLVTMSAFSAQARMDSHYGKATKKGVKYACTYTNATGSTLDMKRVEFQFSAMGRHGEDVTVTNNVAQRVQPGYSITSVVSAPIGAVSADFCRFWSK
jgi:hypothetical protein